MQEAMHNVLVARYIETRPGVYEAATFVSICSIPLSAYNRSEQS
jgi:hypothetical protein